MRRRRCAIIACLGLTSGCATAHGARDVATVSAAPVQFAASSMPSGYGIQLRLEGSAVVRDHWLYIVVPTGSVRTYQGTADAWDLVVRAGLVVCDGHGEGRLVSESRAERIAPLVGLTRDSAMLDTTVRTFRDTLRLDLGVPDGTQLDRARLIFEPAWPVGGALATYTIPARITIVSSDGTISPTGVREASRSSRSRCSA